MNRLISGWLATYWFYKVKYSCRESALKKKSGLKRDWTGAFQTSFGLHCQHAFTRSLNTFTFTSFCYYGNGREATYWKTGKLFRFRPYIKVKYFFSTDLKWMVGMLLPRETNPPRYHLSLVVQQPLHQLHGKIMGPRHQYRQGSTVTWHKAPSPELLPQFLPWLS